MLRKTQLENRPAIRLVSSSTRSQLRVIRGGLCRRFTMPAVRRILAAKAS
jgi:hypothetical protein